MSRPSVETIRPSFIGYSRGWRSATRRGSRSNDRRRRAPATSSTVAWAMLERLVERRAAAPRARRARNAREKPPTRTLTGWIGRPPMQLDDPVAGLLEAQAALDAPAGGRWPARGRSGSRGSRARGAGRRGARGSRSTRRSRAAGGAPGSPGRPRSPNSVLERVDGGHLVGDRADAADAGDDVDDLVGRPADDEPLEVARRLEDLEVRLVDDAVADAAGGASPRPRRGSGRRCRRRGRRSTRPACRCHASLGLRRRASRPVRAARRRRR